MPERRLFDLSSRAEGDRGDRAHTQRAAVVAPVWTTAQLFGAGHRASGREGVRREPVRRGKPKDRVAER